jgi:hypothetical protein
MVSLKTITVCLETIVVCLQTCGVGLQVSWETYRRSPPVYWFFTSAYGGLEETYSLFAIARRSVTDFQPPVRTVCGSLSIVY